MRRTLFLIGATLLAITPAAAQRLHSLNPQDVEQAERENAGLVQELGGAERGPRAAYVAAVGQRVSAYSGIASPSRELHFVTLDSGVENAFSVPGGYVYVTRQLMALMDDESELAFAIGHEVGHVAANHAHIREQYVEQSSGGMFGQIIGAIFGPGAADIFQARSRLDLLSFSRDQEYEADRLGVKYMAAAGYDPAGAARMLAALARESALQVRVEGRSNRQIPEWASTHPLSQNRMERALAEAQGTGRLGKGVRNRDAFLNALEGVYVDDDPAQGIIDGPVFTHPDLRIQFRVPQGYLMSNASDAVTVSGSAGKAQFRQGPPGLDRSIAFAFRELTGGGLQIRYAVPRRTVINQMPAAFTTAEVETSAGLMDASVVAYQWDAKRFYYFVMLTPGGSGITPFLSMIRSLHRITPAQAATIRPRIIHIQTVRRGDTMRSLSERMAYRDFRLERFLSLNGLDANGVLVPGQRVKLVVYGTRRS